MAVGALAPRSVPADRLARFTDWLTTVNEDSQSNYALRDKAAIH
jgi:hypothetical protein